MCTCVPHRITSSGIGRVGASTGSLDNPIDINSPFIYWAYLHSDKTIRLKKWFKYPVTLCDRCHADYEKKQGNDAVRLVTAYPFVAKDPDDGYRIACILLGRCFINEELVANRYLDPLNDI